MKDPLLAGLQLREKVAKTLYLFAINGSGPMEPTDKFQAEAELRKALMEFDEAMK